MILNQLKWCWNLLPPREKKIKLSFILTKSYQFCRTLFNILSDLQELAQFQSDIQKLNLNRIFVFTCWWQTHFQLAWHLHGTYLITECKGVYFLFLITVIIKFNFCTVVFKSLVSWHYAPINNISFVNNNKVTEWCQNPLFKIV